MYLDDGLGFGKDLQTCSNASNFVQYTLTQTGLLINKEKYIFQPVQCLEWIGLVWDSRLYSLSIPNRRIADTNESIKFLIDRFPKFTARDLAKAAGELSPCFISRRRKIRIAVLVAELEKFESKRLIQDYLPVTFMFSDVGDIAAGAYTVEVNEKIFFILQNMV